MQQTVWKFPLALAETQEVAMPIGADILHLEVQNGRPCLWALVDPGADEEIRRFMIVGTGHGIPLRSNKQRHVGTFLVEDGEFVFHVFEY